jgi:glycerol kinase
MHSPVLSEVLFGRAMVLGMMFGSDKRHIARSALESISYQIKDVMTVMEQDSDIFWLQCLSEK